MDNDTMRRAAIGDCKAGEESHQHNNDDREESNHGG